MQHSMKQKLEKVRLAQNVRSSSFSRSTEVGQFVGLAQMIGKVDFSKDMDFWQLDKWNGFFPVKWHVIKDAYNKEFATSS